jgi:hypothetical protein
MNEKRTRRKATWLHLTTTGFEWQMEEPGHSTTFTRSRTILMAKVAL